MVFSTDVKLVHVDLGYKESKKSTRKDKSPKILIQQNTSMRTRNSSKSKPRQESNKKGNINSNKGFNSSIGKGR